MKKYLGEGKEEGEGAGPPEETFLAGTDKRKNYKTQYTP